DIECPYHDSGAAIQNMLLAFHYYGLGACYVSDTGINCEQNREVLQLKDYEKITAFIWFGHSEVAPIAPARRNLDEIIEFK
ncbi:MAG: nitroreductase family protein, partial [Planctomycetes bacterium]|nr:nitroreductase family protein [Planctomycetota bacterium]